MIAYLKGTVAGSTESALILDVNQVGYQVFISARDASAMPARGQEVKVYTWMSVSQDAIRLFGFLHRDDLEMFRLLQGVSGIGPKAALGVLSALTADDLRFAVLSGDTKAITRAPGIGAKTAQKIILELKDKMDLADAFGSEREDGELAGAVSTLSSASSAKDEAIQALTALGYSGSDALRAIRKLELTDEMDTETILKLALKQMAQL